VLPGESIDLKKLRLTHIILSEAVARHSLAILGDEIYVRMFLMREIKKLKYTMLAPSSYSAVS